MSRSSFEARHGFLRSAATLANWRLSPYSQWTFQNVAEFVPSAMVFLGEVEDEPVDPGSLLDLKLPAMHGAETLRAFLHRSQTDSLAVMKSGRFVADYASATSDPAAPHIVFSITKSLTAILLGTLEDEGSLDPSRLVTHYLPEARGSAFADATIRDCLDMRVSLAFEETYLDPESAFARYRRAMLWNPGGSDEPLASMILSIQKGAEPHGGPFRYRSPNSDLLGLIAERVSGERFADLLRDRIATKIGARGPWMVTVDAHGTARAAGGLSMTARDLARVGEMMRNGGMAGSQAVVTERWVADAVSGGDRNAWQAGDFAHLLAGGSYRSQWYQTGWDTNAFAAIGIHGQWLFVDPAHEVVIARLSSQALPVDDPLDLASLDAFRAIAAAV